MRIIFCALLVLSSKPAYAWFGNSNTAVTQEYACLSYDGVPIQNGTTMSSQCCSNGQLVANAPDTCRAGFNSIGPAAGAGAAYNIEIAQNALTTAQNMDGASTDYNHSLTDSGSSSGKTTSGSSSDSSAITGSTYSGVSGGSTSGSGSSGDSALKSGSGSTAGSGSGSDGSGAGGSGSSAGMDSSGTGGTGSSSGSKTAAKNGTDSSNSDKDSRLAYVSGSNGANGGAGGANAFHFGGAGSGGAGTDKALNELNLGDKKTERDPNALANADEDGAVGTAEDPADYFKRIDQSANIFKIVSSRYLKKKSLFKVKED